MLSRVAESVYWMTRYLERAENIARFIDVNLHLTLDLGMDIANQHWQTLVTTSGDTEDFEKRYSASSEEKVFYFLVFDEDNPNSILSCLRNARENARTIRDTIPSEMWEHINRFYLLILKNKRKKMTSHPQQFLYEVKMASHLLIGISESIMTHEEAWHFSRVGRLLERADKTARILDVKYYLLLPQSEYINSSLDDVQWAALLKSISAFEMYKKKYHTISYTDIADFLIFNPEFPRSFYYCITVALRSMRSIIAYVKTDCSALGELSFLKQQLSSCTLEDTLQNGLHEFIDRFQFNLNVVDGEIKKSFFEFMSDGSNHVNKHGDRNRISEDLIRHNS